jgi:hypothetical protein
LFCGGDWLYVISEADCTPDDNPPTIETTCCPDRLLPEVLTATVSGDCSGVCSLVYDPVAQRWEGGMSLPLGILTVRFYCHAVQGWLADLGSCYNATGTSLTGTCDPLSLSFGPFSAAGCCGGDPNSLVLTVTEP